MFKFTLPLSALLVLTLLAGPVLAESVSPVTVDGATTVDTNKARELFDQRAAFVDVRSNSDWDAGRIPGAIHIELKKVYNETSLAAEVQKDEPLVIYCNGPSCPRSAQASELAVSWGYSKVYYYREGYPAWTSAGNPVE